MLVAIGLKAQQAASFTGQTPRNVYNAIHRYLAHHKPEDLMDRPGVAGQELLLR